MIGGSPDPIYVHARRVLLDALDVLAPFRDAIILVGAQAIYLHTGDTGLAVAPYTTDADLALNPELLVPDPTLESAMRRAGFVLAPGLLGIWVQQPGQGTVDILVPESLGGPGRRGARLGPHGNRVARKVRGLEAAVVDNVLMTVQPIRHATPFARLVRGGFSIYLGCHRLRQRQGSPNPHSPKRAQTPGLRRPGVLPSCGRMFGSL